MYIQCSDVLVDGLLNPIRPYSTNHVQCTSISAFCMHQVCMRVPTMISS